MRKFLSTFAVNINLDWKSKCENTGIIATSGEPFAPPSLHTWNPVFPSPPWKMFRWESEDADLTQCRACASPPTGFSNKNTFNVLCRQSQQAAVDALRQTIITSIRAGQYPLCAPKYSVWPEKYFRQRLVPCHWLIVFVLNGCVLPMWPWFAECPVIETDRFWSFLTFKQLLTQFLFLNLLIDY